LKSKLTMQTQTKNETIKIPVKLYRIGELVDYTPFSRQTIHNYTIMGLIRESKWTEGGHRLYDESVFERLSEIMQLKKTKTLMEIRQILNKKHKYGKDLSSDQISNANSESVADN
jgi:DNA-binding transcriptional MerR regulator